MSHKGDAPGDGSGTGDHDYDVHLATVTTETASTTLDDTDAVVLVDASGAVADITITLPTASGITGREYVIKRIDADFDFNVVVDGNGGETIDGDTTQTLYFEDELIRIVSDGTNWHIIGREWGKIHRVRLRRNSSLSIANATDVVVPYGSTGWSAGTTEQEDVGDLHSTSTNTSRVTVKRPGWYRCTIFTDWDSSSSGVRFHGFPINGASLLASEWQQQRTANGSSLTTISADVYLAAGDYVEHMVRQNSGGSRSLDEMRFYVRWIPDTE